MRLVVLCALIVLLLDQASKWAVVHVANLIDLGVIEVWPPFLTFRMGWNQGINFGLFAHDADVMRWVLIGVALAIAAFVLIWIARPGHGRIARVAAGLLVGGAIGNVIDRILYGAVADFLNMSCCGVENPFVFNVADVAIFAGAFGLALFGTDPAKSAAKGRKTP